MMSRHRFHRLLRMALATTLLAAGCGKHDAEHEHPQDAAGHGHHEDHDPPETAEAAASFKPGVGVRLTEEIERNLGVETAPVTTRRQPNQVRLTVQVYDERHRAPVAHEDHTGCDVHSSGFLPRETAAAIAPGQPALVFKDPRTPLSGVVLAVQHVLALGESEIVIGVSNAVAALRPGEFLEARIDLPRAPHALAVPKSAVLRTAEGAFVYAVNQRAYLRTPVTTGPESDNWTEILDGLPADARVVTQPVQTLYLIELRATKGGGHGH